MFTDVEEQTAASGDLEFALLDFEYVYSGCERGLLEAPVWPTKNLTYTSRWSKSNCALRNSSEKIQ
jgi:hypothetical protein